MSLLTVTFLRLTGGACGSPYGTAAATRISVYGLLCSTPPPAGVGLKVKRA